MVADNDVDVIQCADADQLALAAAIADLAFVDHLALEVDFNKLLGRNAEEDDVAVHGFLDLGIAQGQGSTHNAGDLGVVAAAVGSAGLGVGIGMVGDGQGVILTHEGNGGALIVLALQITLNAGDGMAFGGLDIQVLEDLGKLAGGSELSVAHFGMGPDVTAKGHDLFLLAVDNVTDFLFQLIHNAYLLLLVFYKILSRDYTQHTTLKIKCPFG